MKLDSLAQGQAEKRQIVAALPPVAAKHREALTLLATYLDDTAVAREAAMAVVATANAAKTSQDPALMKSLLERVVRKHLGDNDLCKDAARLSDSPVTAIAQAPGDLPFFDGKTLNGWEGNLAIWRIEDGGLVGGSLNGNLRNEFLVSRKDYGDFVLRFTVKVVGTKGFINGGMQIRSQRLTQPENEMIGYQVDIGAGFSGSLYDESRRKKTLMRPDAALIKGIEKLNDWNQYEVVCQGPRIVIRVNGEQTVNYTETDPTISLTGRFGFQIHGGCHAEIRFRDVTIQELPLAK